MQKMVNLILLLLITIALSNCASKPVYVQQPFMQFQTYELPKVAPIQVERNCKAKYNVGDYKTTVDVGDCVRVKDFINRKEYAHKLERIIKGYEDDIESYNKIHKPKKNILWHYR